MAFEMSPVLIKLGKSRKRNLSLQERISFNRRRETPENHVEIVVEIIPIRVHAQQKENSADNTKSKKQSVCVILLWCIPCHVQYIENTNL